MDVEAVGSLRLDPVPIGLSQLLMGPDDPMVETRQVRPLVREGFGDDLLAIAGELGLVLVPELALPSPLLATLAERGAVLGQREMELHDRLDADRDQLAVAPVVTMDQAVAEELPVAPAGAR
jgi:hypothetical protein